MFENESPEFQQFVSKFLHREFEKEQRRDWIRGRVESYLQNKRLELRGQDAQRKHQEESIRYLALSHSISMEDATQYFSRGANSRKNEAVTRAFFNMPKEEFVIMRNFFRRPSQPPPKVYINSRGPLFMTKEEVQSWFLLTATKLPQPWSCGFDASFHEMQEIYPHIAFFVREDVQHRPMNQRFGQFYAEFRIEAAAVGTEAVPARAARVARSRSPSRQPVPRSPVLRSALRSPREDGEEAEEDLDIDEVVITC
jgi:hypothetical protein